MDSQRVVDLMVDSLYRFDELSDDETIPEGAVVVEGIVNTFGFHPKRLESHRDEVIAMLRELPETFQKDVGGGWSFLHMCNDKNGEQWTSFHKCMDELLSLGIGLGVAAYCAPRDMWDIFPGAMPYVVFDLPKGESDDRDDKQ